MNTIFPWQTQQWELLQRRRKQQNLPHAILLLGPRGIGKLQFAQQFAYSLLCANPSDEGYACGSCKFCKLQASETHVDLHYLQPLEKANSISVQQIRDLNPICHQRSYHGSYRVIIINSADQLNTAAANALLKLLEEPGEGVIFVLLCSVPDLLLPTIRSRCQAVLFNPASLQQTIDFVGSNSTLASLAQGAPLTAQRWLSNEWQQSRSNLLDNWFAVMLRKTDPIQAAAAVEAIDLADFYQILISVLHDALQLQLRGAKYGLLNADYIEDITDLAQHCSAQKLLSLVDNLLIINKSLLERANLNKRLQLDAFFCEG